MSVGPGVDDDRREIAAPALPHIDAGEQEAIDAAWEETIDRRLNELASGCTAPVSGRETRAMGRALLEQRRR